MPEPHLDMPRCRGIDIEEFSIAQLRQHLDQGKFSVQDLTVCYLGRIQQLNGRLKAVIETNPDAVQIAEALDREMEMGELRSPLHGIPFLLKDNIATRDRMETTAGASVLVGTRVAADASVVSLLRDSGAVLLGKANLSEWASMRSTYYAEGYSARGGQCRNPYNLAEHAGGSSNGSAVAVATNMCAFSLGTETDSSVIFPADRCGIVGIKPTVGLIPCDGVIPESHNFDTVGVFGRGVPDAAMALDAVCGNLAKSGCYSASATTKSALVGARFGMPRKRVWEKAQRRGTATQYGALMGLVASIREAGAEVVAADLPSAEEIVPAEGSDWDYPADRPDQSEFTVVKTDFYNDVKKYLARLERNPKGIGSLEDIVAYNAKHAKREGGVPGVHPAWPSGQDGLLRSLESKGIEDGVYHHAIHYLCRKSRDEGIDAALNGHGAPLDGLLVPVQADDLGAVQVAAKAGYPMITIPVGIDHNGVPFGLGVVQTANREDSLIRYGSAIEDLIGVRPKPRFRNIDASNYPYIGAPGA